jgi:hypothetical protein
MDTNLRQQPVANERADNANCDIAYKSETSPLYDFASQPASQPATRPTTNITSRLSFEICTISPPPLTLTPARPGSRLYHAGTNGKFAFKFR